MLELVSWVGRRRVRVFCRGEVFNARWIYGESNGMGRVHTKTVLLVVVLPPRKKDVLESRAQVAKGSVETAIALYSVDTLGDFSRPGAIDTLYACALKRFPVQDMLVTRRPGISSKVNVGGPAM